MGSNSIGDLVLIIVLIITLIVVLKPPRIRPKWEPSSMWDDSEHCKRMQGICDRKVENTARREAIDLYDQYQSQYTRWLFSNEGTRGEFLPFVFPSRVHLTFIEVAGPNCIPKYNSSTYKELVREHYHKMIKEDLI